MAPVPCEGDLTSIFWVFGILFFYLLIFSMVLASFFATDIFITIFRLMALMQDIGSKAVIVTPAVSQLDWTA